MFETADNRSEINRISTPVLLVKGKLTTKAASDTVDCLRHTCCRRPASVRHMSPQPHPAEICAAIERMWTMPPRLKLKQQPAGFPSFGSRVEALAANQDLLVKNAWKGPDLDELVRVPIKSSKGASCDRGKNGPIGRPKSRTAHSGAALTPEWSLTSVQRSPEARSSSHRP